MAAKDDNPDRLTATRRRLLEQNTNTERVTVFSRSDYAGASLAFVTGKYTRGTYHADSACPYVQNASSVAAFPMDFFTKGAQSRQSPCPYCAEVEQQ